jgi:predicted nicotinamide N-methyase
LASASDHSGKDNSAASAVSGLPADALFEVMRSRFDVSVEMVRVGAGEFRVASVRQPEKLLDAITTTEFAVDERLPYWAELWTSAIVLAERVLNDQTMHGTKVLELGCGLGLVGLAAAKAGADVTMTDYDPDALMFARWNMLANLSASDAGHVSIRPLDWREAPGDRYDMILGADIVYEQRHIVPMMTFLTAAAKPGGRILVAEPGRRIGDDFMEYVGHCGGDVTIEKIHVHRRGRSSTVRLLTIRPAH